ncbi:MAG: ABC transporter ATP-binding protein [Ilumatobacteraceae bacterium]
MTSAALDVHELSKDFGDAAVVGPLTLEVADGERVVIIGHNGSGKTTMLRMVAGLLEPSTGGASVDGHPVGSIEARAATSYLADQPVFYDDLSVREHLEFIARLHGREDWATDADELLDRLALTDRADHLPRTFSRGLRQRVAIAIAMIRPFSLLLVDEPFVGLDRSGRDALLALLAQAHQRGAALLVATHELTTVGELDRVIALRDGSIVFDGSATSADLAMLTTK